MRQKHWYSNSKKYNFFPKTWKNNQVLLKEDEYLNTLFPIELNLVKVSKDSEEFEWVSLYLIQNR